MMKIKEMLRSDYTLSGNVERDVTGVAYDSRKVKSGDLFVAVRGGNADGSSFIGPALQNGAAGIVYEKGRLSTEQRAAFATAYPGTIWIGVEDARDALAYLSGAVCGNPSHKMAVIGITGTNGKTTTSYLLKAVLEKWGKKVGLVGTIGYLIGDKAFDAPHTTPEAPDFQSLLKEMDDSGCSHVVAEVSSHALAQKRVAYTNFRVAVFTNLTRDHLDFHRTMEEYYKVKETLFAGLLARDGVAVINVDDPYGRRLADTLRQKNGPIIMTCSVEGGEADLVVRNMKTSFSGTRFTVEMRREGETVTEEFSTPLVGKTNVYNVLSAVCAALSLHIPITIIKEGVSMTGLVKGRFEKVDLGQDFLAVVDYAHTEDALERLLLTARQLLEAYRFAVKTEKMMKAKRRHFSLPGAEAESGKIITVIGCGGNRDKGKRSKMGEIASKLSDFVIITSDNPRNEDPRTIIRDMEKGIKGDNYIVISDRNVAIGMAVELASSGDIVLVAGKGHEDYQEIQGIRHSFSDRAALECAIKKTTSRPAFGGDTTYRGSHSAGSGRVIQG
jgi:UDP-N-acetylmuramoyl-L-alanyl-D-glutamate--2,6-diaminopimelate ligase